MKKIVTVLLLAVMACSVSAKSPIEIRMLSYNIRTLADDGAPYISDHYPVEVVLSF